MGYGHDHGAGTLGIAAQLHLKRRRSERLALLDS